MKDLLPKGILVVTDESSVTDSLRLLLAQEGFEVVPAEKFTDEDLECDGETFGMVGRDHRLQEIQETIRTAAPAGASVLIEGESGTGKQLIATALHEQSQRAARPFVRLDCVDVPNELCDAIEAANGGTLLLDEIASLPVHLQLKLLQVLQERKLGVVPVDIRLLSLTSRNTSSLVDEGLLRKDLYFRTSTIKITVPPLRERLDDLPCLVKHFLKRFSKQYKKKVRSIAPETMLRLFRYDWPGNIRELENVIERAVLFCKGTRLLPQCLPQELRRSAVSSSSLVIPPFVPMVEIEREAILQTLERTSGNVKRTAQILRFPRPTFYRKLKKLGIKVERPAHKLATSV